MPQSGQIIPAHLYPHEHVEVHDNTGYKQVMPEQVDDSTHVLFVFHSSKGIDNKIQDVKNGLQEFVAMYGQGPFSIYGQPYLNAYHAFESGYITGHCLRVTAENATYAVSVLVALYAIDETGKVTIKFKTRTVEEPIADLSNIEDCYTSPEEPIADGSEDDGFTEVKLLTVAAKGRGSYGKKLSYGISSNTGGDKENNYKNYIFHVYENFETLKEVERHMVCISEDAIIDNEAKFIDGIVNSPTKGSKRVQVHTNIAGFQQILDAYNDANEDSEFTIDDFDVLLGIDKYTKKAINNYEIDSMSDDIVILSVTGGISLEGGDDGDLDESADPKIREAALESAYLKAFSGDVDPMIFSKNRYPCHVMFDANYSVPVKRAMAALCERRTDCTLYLDMGLDLRSMRSPITYVKNNLDSYVRNRNEWIGGICGKNRDPYSKKICTLTYTYSLVYRLPMHWNEHGGRHVPFAGNVYGIIDEDFIEDSIYPLYDDCLHAELMDEMVEERINFARINAKQRVIIATQTTRQEITSNLSEMNNVQILLDIKRDCEELCAEYQYNFSEPEDIVKFNKDAEVLLSKYEGTQVRNIEASFDKNDWEAERGILHLYVDLEHRDLVKTSIIEIDVNRGSSSTKNE